MKNDILYLIEVTYIKNEIGDTIEKFTQKMIFCEVKSINAQEFYNAHRQKFKLSKMFIINADDYNEELYVMFKNKRYRVVRTYEKDFTHLELVCEGDFDGNSKIYSTN